MILSKLLLHVCCGPCAAGVNTVLQEEGWDVTNLFYNPNIHPHDEYYQRYESFITYLNQTGQKGIIPYSYQPREYFQSIDLVSDRCIGCYQLRLQRVAEWGSKNGFKYFVSTLTISPYQDQDKIFEIGERIAHDYDMVFLKKDFRPYYRASVEYSRGLNLYRQKYCGCLFSRWEGEKKRLWRSLTG